MDFPPARRTSAVDLARVCHSYILEAAPGINAATAAAMDEIVSSCITGVLDALTATQRSISLIGTARPIERLMAILTATDQPLCATVHPRLHFANVSSRKKTELWSEPEDIRLLAGIHKFGIGEWGSIAWFVGNNRTKGQCCQRWCRGLDPRISKSLWTVDEDERLEELVKRFGTKSWTRIAMELGNRCDAQCRYRFNQLHQAEPVSVPLSCPAMVHPSRPLLPSIQSLLSEETLELSSDEKSVSLNIDHRLNGVNGDASILNS
jgi:hypothetical protein